MRSKRHLKGNLTKYEQLWDTAKPVPRRIFLEVSEHITKEEKFQINNIRFPLQEKQINPKQADGRNNKDKNKKQ